VDSPAECIIGTMLRAQGIRPAQTHAFEGLLQVTAEGERFTQFNQTTEGALAVRCGGVEQDTGHRATFFAGVPRIQALAHAGSGVAAV